MLSDARMDTRVFKAHLVLGASILLPRTKALDYILHMADWNQASEDSIIMLRIPMNMLKRSYGV